MKSARLHSRGFTLIATLLMLLLMSGVAIGLMMMVNSEGKVGGTDLQNNLAYHNAEGGIEKMTADLAATFKSMQAPKAADICNLSNLQPTVAGVTWKDYQVQPSTGCVEANFKPSNGQISSGPNQGLYAQIIPVTMLATAAQAGGQEVSMTRSAQVALIPVFQFGVFSDSDLSFFSGPNFDFAGRVHTNGDLYPAVGNGSTLTFHDKITVFGNVIRTQLANGLGTAGNYNGTVQLPTAGGGCDTPTPPLPPLPLPACRALAMSEGSVLGAGGNPAQSGSNYGTWAPVSTGAAPGGYNHEIVNGNFGLVNPNPGTGAKILQLPFVSAGNQPFEIIRRPRAADAPALSDSREYNMAQIRVLLSDDPAELPAGAVRLANVGANAFGIPAPVAPSAFPGNIIPALGAGLTYNTYFATSTQGLPDTSPCNNTNCGTNAAPTAIAADWPFAPAAHPPGDTVVPANAPLINGGVAPAFALCPPTNSNPAAPAGCPAAPGIPYYVANNALPFPLPATAANWNLLDGWLSVQYKDAAGNWQDATGEWLNLGFARGTNPPTVAGANGIHPNAIIILQQPADRDGNGVVDDTGQAPVCTRTGGNPLKCIAWNYGRPPEVVSDFTAVGAGSTSPFVGISGANSISKNNWYPINIYDTREGEPRDVVAGNNSCSAAGVMNGVEIDVGNLKRWLWGQIGVSGANVDYVAQNGWVLYISDRRGMLKNPNPPYNGAERSGDSGLEDSINTASAAGIPDGVLEPKTGVMPFPPEDVNKNGLADFYGSANLGLGFYNSIAPNAGNLNTAIVGAAPDNQYIRINSCLATGRKNWVSGARHAVKLVDGGFNNVPYRTAAMGGTLASPGGFTVASENPVYIQGDYNSSAADTAWGGGADQPGHAAASVIADAVTLLSNNWSDLKSFTSPTTLGARAAVTSYYRLAIAGGKNMNFPKPNWGAQDYGTDGGTHNFLRYLENWGGQTLWYKGSLVSLYYSTYNTGVFKCCAVVYSAPGRKYSFDADFALPGGLPPGTPLFRDVDTLGYRQLFAVRDK